MNLLLFLVTIFVACVVVRIGAIAFELTGLEWSIANFQALSCFTGTGFTTREAELITGSPQRRHIAAILMVLGHAGLVTMIATFANSLRPHELFPKFTLPFINVVFPSQVVPWVNLAIIVVVIYIGYIFFTNTKFMKKVTGLLRKRIKKTSILHRVSFEELLVATGGYGVSSIKICKSNPIIGKTLRESNLKRHGIMVLAMERKREVMPNPAADTEILLDDTLVCFGKLGDIRDKLYVIPGKPCKKS